MNLEGIKQEDWILGGLALLLAITLLFFPWYHVSASFGLVSVSANRSATSSPYALWGVLALVTSLALIVDLAIERLSPHTQIPALGGSRTATRLVIVGVTLLLLVIKFLAHVGSFGWGFFVALVVMAALVYFALQANAGALPFVAGGRPRATGAGPTPPAAPPAAPPTSRPTTPGAGAPGAGTPPGTGGAPGPGGTPPGGTSGPGGSTPPPAGP